MNSIDNSLKTLTKGAGIIFVGIFISKILAYLYRVAVARIGTEEYGLISLGIAITAFVTIFAVFGLDTIILRYIPILEKEDKQKLKEGISFSIKFSFILSIILAILLFLFADTIATKFFHNSEFGIILKILSFSIPLASLRNVFVSIMRAYKKVNWMIYSKEIGENLIKIIFTILFIFLGFSLYGAAFAYVLAMLGSAIIAYFFLKSIHIKLFTKIKNYGTGMEFLFNSWPLLFNDFLILMIGWIDTIMLGYFKTTSLVGIYNAAMPTALLLQMFPKALITLFLPVIASSYLEDKEYFKKIYKIVTKWILIIDIIILFFILVFPKIILKVLFGNDYIPGSNALIILSFGIFISSLIIYNSRDILILFKKTKIIFIITLFCVLLNIILNYILIPIYSIEGAALAASISFILMSVLMYLFTYLNIKTNIFTLKFIKITFSALMSIIFVYIISSHLPDINFILFLLLIILLCLIYPIFLLITKSFEEEDIMILRAIQQKTGLNISFINKILKKFV